MSKENIPTYIIDQELIDLVNQYDIYSVNKKEEDKDVVFEMNANELYPKIKNHIKHLLSILDNILDINMKDFSCYHHGHVYDSYRKHLVLLGKYIKILYDYPEYELLYNWIKKSNRNKLYNIDTVGMCIYGAFKDVEINDKIREDYLYSSPTGCNKMFPRPISHNIKPAEHTILFVDYIDYKGGYYTHKYYNVTNSDKAYIYIRNDIRYLCNYNKNDIERLATHGIKYVKIFLLQKFDNNRYNDKNDYSKWIKFVHWIEIDELETLTNHVAKHGYRVLDKNSDNSDNSENSDNSDNSEQDKNSDKGDTKGKNNKNSENINYYFIIIWIIVLIIILIGGFYLYNKYIKEHNKSITK